MRTEIYIRPPSLYLKCDEVKQHHAFSIGYDTRWDSRSKAFKTPFCPETLINAKKYYPDAEIKEGQEHIEKMKLTMLNLELAKRFLREGKALHPDHQYKLKPFVHQLRGLAYLNFFDGAALFADCGTGKTAMTLWDIEVKYQQKKIDPSSVLVVGKLMTLFSGWKDDASEFTDLSAEVLWAPSKTKVVKGEKTVCADYGPKPKGKARYLSKVEYFHKDGSPAILAGPRHFNPRKHVSKLREWKQVGDVKYGEETIATSTRFNLRTEDIRRRIGSSVHDIHVINHEGLIQFTDELSKRKYEYIVIDESTAIKNPKSKIFKALMKIAESSKFRRILSGTPSPQGPQDLWAQFYFLDGGITLGPDFDIMVDRHFERVQLGSHDKGTFKGEMIKLSKQKNTMGWVNRCLQNRIFVCKLRECVDLPPLLPKKLDVFLTDVQKSHYEDMQEKMLTVIDGDEINVTVELAKVAKLRQITGGFIINHEGLVKEICKKNPKLLALESLIEEFDNEEKVVIFAVHRCEIKMLLDKFGRSAVAIYGGVSDKQKFDAQRRFMEDPTCRYIICQPQSAAYGVDGLQKAARYLVFYSIDYRADTNYQAIKRIERTGQQRAMFVYYLIASGTIDEVIFEVIKDKEDIQQKTLDTEILSKLKEVISVTKGKD